MNQQDSGENRVAVPASLVQQLQNMTTKGGDTRQSAPGAPNPTPRPVNPNQETRAED